jgi:hypothetical protein
LFFRFWFAHAGDTTKNDSAAIVNIGQVWNR